MTVLVVTDIVPDTEDLRIVMMTSGLPVSGVKLDCLRGVRLSGSLLVAGINLTS